MEDFYTEENIREERRSRAKANQQNLIHAPGFAGTPPSRPAPRPEEPYPHIKLVCLDQTGHGRKVCAPRCASDREASGDTSSSSMSTDQDKFSSREGGGEIHEKASVNRHPRKQDGSPLVQRYPPKVLANNEL
jgi:hypothetical protein